ncbi:pyridoxal-dependent decarboxylase [Escherichia coli]|uniref:pyridoxal-dependent decarboxylase n=1 Tax=Escherichia coli TaxID=562 RepID=UPI0020340314|nr:pyridoxal-dependent decarboxylase [Escherichia coli]
MMNYILMATLVRTRPLSPDWDDENVHKLMDLSINKNWIDKKVSRNLQQSTCVCVNMVADLWHAPPKMVGAVGTNTIGSSEARMLGRMAMKWRWRKRMEAAGKPTDKPNWCAVRYKSAGINSPATGMWSCGDRCAGQLFMDPKRMIEACDENTIRRGADFRRDYTGNYEFSVAAARCAG